MEEEKIGSSGLQWLNTPRRFRLFLAALEKTFFAAAGINPPAPAFFF
jgi:hypothetical protein